MLYIHALKDFNLKNAEIETTQIIRELKKNVSLPLSAEVLKNNFDKFFMSDADKESIVNALKLISPTIEMLKKIFDENNPIHEPINFKRAVSVLSEILEPLINNLNYADGLRNGKEHLIQELARILNSIPSLITQEEKIACNNSLKSSFEKILRNSEFFFNFKDVINEAQLEHINSLSKSMENGFLFHVMLEEEIRKDNFEAIKKRIPAEELARINAIAQNIVEIKKGVERAYEGNMRMVEFAVTLYSYVKWLMAR